MKTKAYMGFCPGWNRKEVISLTLHNWRALLKTMLSGKLTFFGVFSKVPEFLLVAFKFLAIHWAAFFFSVLRFVFKKKRMQKTQVFVAACFWDLSLNEKQKKPFVCLNNESSEALHTSQTSWVFCLNFPLSFPILWLAKFLNPLIYPLTEIRYEEYQTQPPPPPPPLPPQIWVWRIS